MADFVDHIESYIAFASTPSSSSLSPSSSSSSSVPKGGSHDSTSSPMNSDNNMSEPLSWSSVGGYDHPQPGSRLLQYGKCSCVCVLMCCTAIDKAVYIFLMGIVLSSLPSSLAVSLLFSPFRYPSISPFLTFCILLSLTHSFPLCISIPPLFHLCITLLFSLSLSHSFPHSLIPTHSLSYIYSISLPHLFLSLSLSLSYGLDA